TARHHIFAIGRECCSVNSGTMPTKSADFLPGCYIPQLGGVVSACGEDIFTIGRKLDTSYRIGVSTESTHFASRDHIPQFGSIIQTACCQILTIRREGYTVNSTKMPRES